MITAQQLTERFRSLEVERNPAYPQNDIGIAQLFFDLHSKYNCYVVEAKAWYAYDGKHWAKDEGGFSIMEQIKTFVSALYGYALSLPDSSEDFVRFTSGLHSRKRRESIIRDACSIRPRSMKDFDKDKWLFNCLNGTINLDNMTFQPHTPDDYLTKMSNAEYHADAICQRWLQFMMEVMNNDEQTAEFLQKAFAYSLTGDTALECFFILYGSTTRNGKTTACETIAHVLGDYARTAQPETMAKRSRDGSAPSPDIARLKGARFVNMPEPELGLELNTALIKQLTGGDTYTGRYLHENPVEFIPEFKIFINTNHLPRTSDDTIFSSDRVKLIPFERHFSLEEQDSGLKPLFRQPENVSGILNWLLKGYRMLRTEGLTPPDKVLYMTNAYRKETDIVGSFLQETIVEAEGSRLQTSQLYRHYTNWTKDNGYRATNSKSFIADIRRRGYEIRRNGTRGNEVLDVGFAPAISTS